MHESYLLQLLSCTLSSSWFPRTPHLNPLHKLSYTEHQVREEKGLVSGVENMNGVSIRDLKYLPIDSITYLSPTKTCLAILCSGHFVPVINADLCTTDLAVICKIDLNIWKSPWTGGILKTGLVTKIS